MKLSHKDIDLTCYDRLHEQFQYMFEPRLIEEICLHGSLHRFEPLDIIMDIGDTMTHLPLILEGSIKVMTEDKAGDELLLYLLEHGDTCAMTLHCCTHRAKSNIRAVAEVQSDLLLIPVAMLDDWLVLYKSWRTYILDSYHTRVTELVSAIDLLVFNSLEDRLVKYLSDKVWVIKSATINITHAEIAADLHSSRVVISRLMKKLEKDRKINQGRNSITYLGPSLTTNQ